jgi:putative transposase
LNSAIGYITPKDMLAGHQQEIQAERDRKLGAARKQRKNRRQGAA